MPKTSTTRSSEISDIRPSRAGHRSSLLDVEILLPEQVETSRGIRDSAEISLLWAIFCDGIQTYCREVLRSSTDSLAYREVHRWIFRSHSNAVTSFASLCDLFAIDTRKLRLALTRFREHPSEALLGTLDRT